LIDRGLLYPLPLVFEMRDFGRKHLPFVHAAAKRSPAHWSERAREIGNANATDQEGKKDTNAELEVRVAFEQLSKFRPL
jgi:hypothetical protein